MSGTSAILLGAMLGAMMGFDLGGPINKVGLRLRHGRAWPRRAPPRTRRS